jgi:hypothetical protein
MPSDFGPSFRSLAAEKRPRQRLYLHLSNSGLTFLSQPVATRPARLHSCRAVAIARANRARREMGWSGGLTGDYLGDADSKIGEAEALFVGSRSELKRAILNPMGSDPTSIRCNLEVQQKRGGEGDSCAHDCARKPLPP